MRRGDWPDRNEALREPGMSTRVTTQRVARSRDVPTRSRRVDQQWSKPLRPAERGHVVDCDAPFGQQPPRSGTTVRSLHAAAAE